MQRMAPQELHSQRVEKKVVKNSAYFDGFYVVYYTYYDLKAIFTLKSVFDTLKNSQNKEKMIKSLVK